MGRLAMRNRLLVFLGRAERPACGVEDTGMHSKPLTASGFKIVAKQGDDKFPSRLLRWIDVQEPKRTQACDSGEGEEEKSAGSAPGRSHRASPKQLAQVTGPSAVSSSASHPHLRSIINLIATRAFRVVFQLSASDDRCPAWVKLMEWYSF